MKQLLDFYPGSIFVCYKLYDIYVASGALVAATAVALVLTAEIPSGRENDPDHLYYGGYFGTLTLVFHNDLFIKWKVTVIYTLFAPALLISRVVLKKPLIQRMLGKELQLPDSVWSRLNAAWALFS